MPPYVLSQRILTIGVISLIILLILGLRTRILILSMPLGSLLRNIGILLQNVSIALRWIIHHLGLILRIIS